MQLLPLPGLSSHHRKWHPAILLTSWLSGNFPQSSPVVGGPGRGLTLCSSSKYVGWNYHCGLWLLHTATNISTDYSEKEARDHKTCGLHMISLLHSFLVQVTLLNNRQTIFAEVKCPYINSRQNVSCILGSGRRSLLSPSCVWCCWSIKFPATTRPGQAGTGEMTGRAGVT